MNPLLDFSGLPRFADVRVEHIGPAIDTLIACVRETVAAISAESSSAEPLSWDSVVAPQFTAMERLDRAWGLVSHLHAVVNSPALREAYNANLRKVTELHAQLSQDSRLHVHYRAPRAALSGSGSSGLGVEFRIKETGNAPNFNRNTVLPGAGPGQRAATTVPVHRQGWTRGLHR